MKRAYFLHRQNAPMAPDHVVYKVWAGESVRDQRKLTQLMAWAFANSATLMTWAEDVDYYLMIEADRVFPGRGLLDFGFVRADISVTEALCLADSDSWEKFESELSTPKAFFHTLMSLDPHRVDVAAGRVVPSSVLPEKRKNLSERYEGEKFIISFI